MGLSEYRIMWIFVFFDLPTETKQQRFDYRKFREFLLKDGFDMHQYSVYKRCCPSREHAEAKTKSIKKHLPNDGNISVMMVTDKQFGMIKHYFCGKAVKDMHPPDQISMF